MKSSETRNEIKRAGVMMSRDTSDSPAVEVAVVEASLAVDMIFVDCVSRMLQRSAAGSAFMVL